MAVHKKKTKDSHKILQITSAIAAWLVMPFIVFKYKKMYKLLSYDALFVIALLALSFVIERSVTSDIMTISQSFLLATGMIATLLIIYAAVKYLFYQEIGKKMELWAIVWKHGVGFLFVVLPLAIAAMLLYSYLDVIFMPEHLEAAELITRYALVLIIYLAFLQFQRHDQEKMLIAVYSGIRNIFTKIGVILYTNLILVAIAYLSYNGLAYLFRVYYGFVSMDPLELHAIFEQVSFVILFVLIICILTTNKTLAFNINAKVLSTKGGK